METKEALCEALKTAWEEIRKHGELHISLHDGKIYPLFLFIIRALLQNRFKNRKLD